MPNLQFYKDIKNQIDTLNCWKNNSILFYSHFQQKHFDHLEKIAAVEAVFEGTQGDETKFDELFANWKKYLLKLVTRERPIYLFYCDFKGFPKSRIRSYKGIFPKSIPKNNVIVQIEVEIDIHRSIIGGFILIDQVNFENAINLFMDSSNSFMIQTSNLNLISNETVRDIIINYIIHNGQSEINFFKLLSFISDDGDFILRIGGDGGDRYLSVQIFGMKDSLILKGFLEDK